MAKETDKKSSSLGEKCFQGVMYLLYGKKAGETLVEKAARLGLIIFILVILALFPTIKKALFP